ncbi:MAG: tetratricopeptide repeat protein [Bacteroidia bacterium]
MKRVRIIFSILLFFQLALFSAQRKNIADSLLKLTDNGITDSLKLYRLNSIGWNLSNHDPAQSREYAEKAIVLALKIIKSHPKDLTSVLKELGAAYNTLGSVAYKNGDFALASKNFLNALSIYEHVHDKPKIASLYNNLGGIDVSVHNYKEGEAYIRKSIELREEISSGKPKDKEVKRALSKAYNNMGSLYGEQNQFDKAMPYYLSALKIKDEIGDTRGAAQTRCNIGEIYMNQKKEAEAYTYFQQALELFRKTDDQVGTVLGLENLGLACATLKKYDEGISCLNEALKIAQKLHLQEDEKITYANFSDLYSYKGDYKTSNQYLRKFLALKDSLLDEKINKQTSELQEKYKSTQKQNEIDLLQQQKKNKDLAASRQRLFLYGVAFTLLLVIILAVVLWNRNKLKQRVNTELGNKNLLIEAQKAEVENQKAIIEESQKEIVDSIHYAQRIQRAVITSDTYISGFVKDFFALYKPKAIVSGDFYWALYQDKRFYLIVADCTGHGVPGAFMSLLNISILNEVVIEKKITSPDLILNEARKDIIKALNPGGFEDAKDGMDCTLFVLDLEKKTLDYASANNSFYLIRNKELSLHPADKMPVGKSPKDHVPFTLRHVQLQEGDLIYMLTDGLADQFGGPKGKKFKYKKLQELIQENSELPLEDQKMLIDRTIEEWRGPLEQVDDILLIGIRI